MNYAVLLQMAGGPGHALAAYAEHIRDQFLRHDQLVSFQPVQAQQQPTA